MVRHGNLAVTLSPCCDDFLYCIDVNETALGEGQKPQNDHDCSGLPLDADRHAIETYLSAALASVRIQYAEAHDLCHAADRAARAGCAAVNVPSCPEGVTT
jgi:hypothetical protein